MLIIFSINLIKFKIVQLKTKLASQFLDEGSFVKSVEFSLHEG